MNKKSLLKLNMCVCALLVGGTLCACASSLKDASQNTVKVKSDGSISSVIVDQFDKTYYSADELSGMAQEEVNTFNADSAAQSISLVSTQMDEQGRVVVLMDYANAQDYSQFNDVSFFYGSMTDALAKGFSMPADMMDVDGNKVSLGVIGEDNSFHVIVSEDSSVITAPYKIRYVSTNAQIMDRYSVRRADGDDNAVFIILAK